MPRKSTRKSFDCTLPQVNCTADRKNFLPKTHEGFSLTLMAKFYLIFQEALFKYSIFNTQFAMFKRNEPIEKPSLNAGCDTEVLAAGAENFQIPLI